MLLFWRCALSLPLQWDLKTFDIFPISVWDMQVNSTASCVLTCTKSCDGLPFVLNQLLKQWGVTFQEKSTSWSWEEQLSNIKQPFSVAAFWICFMVGFWGGSVRINVKIVHILFEIVIIQKTKDCKKWYNVSQRANLFKLKNKQWQVKQGEKGYLNTYVSPSI